MAQVKISALTAADPLTGIEEAPFVQGGATKKATAEQIRAYVASQPNVFTVTQRIEDAAPALQFSENDTVDQNWEFIGVAGALRLDELNDAFSTTGTHHTFTHGGGTQFGSPTGGDQGAGTVNAVGLYENGTGVAKLSGGADANFTAMPQVGGDPIVESDSNADGAWTRWADGTGKAFMETPVDVTSTSVQTFTIPTGFVSTPIKPSIALGHGTAGTNVSLSFDNIRGVTYFGSPSRVAVRLKTAGTSNDPASSAEKLAFSVTGWWK